MSTIELDLEEIWGEITDEELEREAIERLKCGTKFDRLGPQLAEEYAEEPDEPDIPEWSELVEVPGRIEQATGRAMRKDYKEALYDLSVALGREFDWLADLKPEHLQ